MITEAERHLIMKNAFNLSINDESEVENYTLVRPIRDINPGDSVFIKAGQNFYTNLSTMRHTLPYSNKVDYKNNRVMSSYVEEIFRAKYFPESQKKEWKNIKFFLQSHTDILFKTNIFNLEYVSIVFSMYDFKSYYVPRNCLYPSKLMKRMNSWE